jgi:Acetyltransferase (GNAT) domain
LTSQQSFRKACTTFLHWPLFAQAFWFDALQTNWQVFHICTNEVDFYFPYIIEKKGIYKLVRNPLLTPYSQLYCTQKIASESIWQQAYKAFEIFLQQFDLVEIDTNPLLNHCEYFKDFSAIAQHTNVLDLAKPIEELLANCKPSLQRHLKFADHHFKQNVLTFSANQSLDASIQNPLFALLQIAEQHGKQKNIYGQQWLNNIVAVCQQNNCGQLFYCNNADGQTQAAIFIVWDAHAAYYVLGASLQPKATRGAMAYLLWHAIQFAQQKNIPIFDFEGSQIPSIDTFFKTFGGKELHYNRMQQFNSASLAVLMKIKNKLKG